MTGAEERRLARHSLRDWLELPQDEKDKLRRIARRWTEQGDLALSEWAVEWGVDFRLLRRAAVDAGIIAVNSFAGEHRRGLNGWRHG